MQIVNVLNLVSLNFKKYNFFEMMKHKIPRFTITFKIYYLGPIIMSGIYSFLVERKFKFYNML